MQLNLHFVIGNWNTNKFECNLFGISFQLVLICILTDCNMTEFALTLKFLSVMAHIQAVVSAISVKFVNQRFSNRVTAQRRQVPLEFISRYS